MPELMEKAGETGFLWQRKKEMGIPMDGLPIPADSGNFLIPREFLGEHQRTKESRVVSVLEDLRFHPVEQTFHFSFAGKAHEESPFFFFCQLRPHLSQVIRIPWPCSQTSKRT